MTLIEKALQRTVSHGSGPIFPKEKRETTNDTERLETRQWRRSPWHLPLTSRMKISLKIWTTFQNMLSTTQSATNCSQSDLHCCCENSHQKMILHPVARPCTFPVSHIRPGIIRHRKHKVFHSPPCLRPKTQCLFFVN